MVSRPSNNDDRTVDTERRTTGDVHVLACAECPRVSSVNARGWQAHHSDDPDEDGPPTLAFYCPECSRREFRNGERQRA